MLAEKHNQSCALNIARVTSDGRSESQDPLFVLEKNFYSSINEMLDSCELISFDVFDTLLRRPFLEPPHLFDKMAALLGNEEFAAARRFAEAKARRKYREALDVNLEQIYEFLDYNPADEIVIERLHLVPRKDVCGLLKTAREKGKKVIAISDMYLPKSVVSEILAANDIFVDDLIVSSTDGVAKYDGSAFRLAARRYDIRLRRFLHFGDNKTSDYEVPASLGMRAVLVGNWVPGGPTCKLTDTLITKLADLGHRASSVGAALRDLRFIFGHYDFWRDLGRYHVGPIVYSFANWIAEQVRARSIEHIIFVARDGWLPFNVYRYLGYPGKASYAYLSRAVLVQASFETMPEATLNQLVSGVAAPVSDYVNRIGLQAEELMAAALEAFKGDPIIDDTNDRGRLSLFFQENRSLLSQQSKIAQENLRAYLNELGVFERPDRVALVEIGWGGTIAAILSHLFAEAKEWHYLFWGTQERFQAPELKHSAQFFEFGEPRHYMDVAFECIELVEFFLSSPEPSVIGLKSAPDGIHPIFSCQGDGWPERSSIARNIERGVMECAKYFSSFTAGEDRLRVDCSVVYAILENVLRTDDLNVVKRLGSIRHQVGMGESKPEILLPVMNYRYWSTIWRWLRGRNMKSRGATIYWRYQQERHFLASYRGIKGGMARLAYNLKQRGGLLRLLRSAVGRPR